MSYKHGFKYTNAIYIKGTAKRDVLLLLPTVFFYFNERHTAIRDFSNHCIMYFVQLLTTSDSLFTKPKIANMYMLIIIAYRVRVIKKTKFRTQNRREMRAVGTVAIMILHRYVPIRLCIRRAGLHIL